LIGAMLVLGITLTALAALGHLGREVANQTLLLNLKMHLVVLAMLAWVAVSALGWPAIGGVGALLAIMLGAMSMSDIRWARIGRCDADETLDLLVFNVFEHNPRVGAIVEWLKRDPPDVALLLEAGGFRDNLAHLDGVFPYRVGCGEDCDTLLLSRIPIEETAILDLPEAPKRMLMARLPPDDDPVWLVGLHWSKGFFTGLSDRQSWATMAKALRRLPNNDDKLIIAGDFNATLWDPAVHRIVERFDLQAPLTWAPTWPSQFGPAGFPIDHVLVSGSLCYAAITRTPGGFGSNHYGVRATLSVNGK
jgi:endonuclease/exonuclease/phosphatase (EEP) superfamily protein YafD